MVEIPKDENIEKLGDGIPKVEEEATATREKIEKVVSVDLPQKLSPQQEMLERRRALKALEADLAVKFEKEKAEKSSTGKQRSGEGNWIKNSSNTARAVADREFVKKLKGEN